MDQLDKSKFTSATEAERQNRTLLTEADLADRWHISPKTLRNQRVQGEGPCFIRIGRLIRYPLGEILKIEADLRQSTSE